MEWNQKLQMTAACGVFNRDDCFKIKVGSRRVSQSMNGIGRAFPTEAKLRRSTEGGRPVAVKFVDDDMGMVTHDDFAIESGHSHIQVIMFASGNPCQ